VMWNKWRPQRRDKGYPEARFYWTADKTAFRVYNAPVRTVRCDGGSSGLIGALVGLQVGGTRVVLAGIPLSAEGRQYDTGKTWDEAEVYHGAWIRAMDRLLGKVRSMSGWTAEQLGAPTAEWLAS